MQRIPPVPGEIVGRKLPGVVQLQVSLVPAGNQGFGGDGKRVRCTGRLDALPEEISVEVLS